MLRVFARLTGFLLLAAGFAALVVDGTRSIAGSEIILTPFSALLTSKLPAMQQAISKNIHPLLWDPVSTSILRLPVWLVLAIAGLFILRLAQRRAPKVGYTARIPG